MVVTRQVIFQPELSLEARFYWLLVITSTFNFWLPLGSPSLPFKKKQHIFETIIDLKKRWNMKIFYS